VPVLTWRLEVVEDIILDWLLANEGMDFSRRPVQLRRARFGFAVGGRRGPRRLYNVGERYSAGSSSER